LLLDKAGIPMLAHQLTQIQASIIARYLPNIVKQINDKLGHSNDELSYLTTVADVVQEVYHIVKKARASLENVLM
jgi:hypothetical protein